MNRFYLNMKINDAFVDVRWHLAERISSVMMLQAGGLTGTLPHRQLTGLLWLLTRIYRVQKNMFKHESEKD